MLGNSSQVVGNVCMANAYRWDAEKGEKIPPCGQVPKPNASRSSLTSFFGSSVEGKTAETEWTRTTGSAKPSAGGERAIWGAVATSASA